MGKIYTRNGDKGTTGTFKGRISKSDDLAEAMGSIDELNSWVGLVISYQLPITNKLKSQLVNIQMNLMKIEALLAGSDNQELKISSNEIRKLEKEIDRMTGELPELKNFIYPVGEIQVVRAVCRRAERAVVRVGSDPSILKYLNRLSDYLFVLARWVNTKNGMDEEVWRS